MFNVCPECGMYSEEKEVRPAKGLRAAAVCPHCGYAHPFLRLPLFAITGASGTGKSVISLRIAGAEKSIVHLETDILWRPAFNQPETDYRDFRNTWLRIAKNVAQAGKPVALYGSVIPSQMEACPERRYLGPIYYLALVCDEEVLAARLRARPAWRETHSEAFVSGMIQFNRWFVEHIDEADPPITLLDTTHQTPEETAGAVRAWLASHWKTNPCTEGER